MENKENTSNISKLERDELLSICENLRKTNPENISEINKLVSYIKSRKYGLIYDVHEELINKKLKENVLILKEEENKKITNSASNKYNFLIEGDNLQSLKLLQKTHKGKIDVIYIDPPYNTGKKDFTYNDSFVGEDDGYRHSKWLSFMKERLDLAYELLSKDGLIFISIDEFEFAQLKVLMDSSTKFSQYNFIENFIWIKNSTKNNSKTTSTNHEYILCYAKNIDVVKRNLNIFQSKKEGYEEVMSLVEKCKSNRLSVEDTQKELRKMLKEHPDWKGISNYDNVDNNYQPFRISDISAPNGKGPHYDVLHPITKKPCKTPSRGWCFTRESMDELLQNDLVYFGKDENIVPQYKRYLHTVETEVVKSIIEDNTDGKKELISIFNVATPDFTNPKPTTLIKTLLKFINKTDITVLDFFAGSGTTGHAVLELNKEDNGTRHFILCTNNEIDSKKTMNLMISKFGEKPHKRKEEIKKMSASELEIYNSELLNWENKYNELLISEEAKNLGICRSTTYPRLKTVITGIRPDGTKYSDGLNGNLKYFKCEMLSKETEYLEDYLLDAAIPLIELTENIDLENSENISIIFDEEEFDEIIEEKNTLLNKIYLSSDVETTSEQEEYIEKQNIEIIDILQRFYKEGE